MKKVTIARSGLVLAPLVLLVMGAIAKAIGQLFTILLIVNNLRATLTLPQFPTLTPTITTTPAVPFDNSIHHRPRFTRGFGRHPGHGKIPPG